MEGNKKLTSDTTMDDRLVQFLKTREVPVGSNKNFTHTSTITPKRKFFIEGNDLEAFYDLYNQVIAEEKIAGITEFPEEVLPLIVDVDIKSTEGPERQYKLRHIRELVGIYQDIIKEIAQIYTEKMLFCVVLEKTAARPGGEFWKDGFHLHFPFFYTEKWVQDNYIRSQVVKRVGENKLFDDLHLIEPLDKVFDKVASKPWLLYGSRKEPSAEPYKVTKYYNHDLDLVTIKDVFKTDYKGQKVWNLPRYLSIRVGATATPLKIKAPEKKVASQVVTQPQRSFKRNPAEVSAFLSDQVQPLMNLLDGSRAEDYSKWMEVGWCLFNVGEGHEKALEYWIDFSRKSSKFVDGQCEQLWSKMEIKNYTMGSLNMWAQEDDEDGYKKYKNTRSEKLYMEGLSMAHNDIAKILYHEYKDSFVCADVKSDIWYEFKNHRWQTSDIGIDLRKKLSREIADKYYDYLEECNRKARIADETNDEAARQSWASRRDKIGKLINKLKISSFKNAVMKEAMEYFYDKDFMRKMDENPDLLVFDNGVYDASIQRVRDGRPDDYCTKSTRINYREYSYDHPQVVKMLELFKKTFVNPNLLRFFTQTASDLVRGGNRHKIFTIWNGDGDNGKSVCADLIKSAFGDYYYTPPTTLLTGKQQQSSGATAELIPCKGARVVVLSETDNYDALNSGTMKKLTGGDDFYARGLHKEPIQIRPQFKLILHCNHLPNVSAEDKASWNRIRVLAFESKFPKNPEDVPESTSEQWVQKVFPRDNTMKDWLPQLAEPFMWWLIKEYERIGSTPLYEPTEVKAATDVYQKTNDFYMQFLDERIQETGDKKDIITLTVVYSLFKEWFKDSFPSTKIPSRVMARDGFTKKMGKPVKGVWYGYTTFDPEANLSSEESSATGDNK